MRLKGRALTIEGFIPKFDEDSTSVKFYNLMVWEKFYSDLMVGTKYHI